MQYSSIDIWTRVQLQFYIYIVHGSILSRCPSPRGRSGIHILIKDKPAKLIAGAFVFHCEHLRLDKFSDFIFEHTVQCIRGELGVVLREVGSMQAMIHFSA